jgi:hypothetical protein
MHPMRSYLADGRRTAAFWLLAAMFVAACLAALAAIGCRRASDTVKDVSVQETISPKPVRVGEATLAIQLADASAEPVTHAKVAVEGDMSHPGMSPIFGTATETSPGMYTAQLDFNMAGDWVVLSHIVLADGRKLERRIDVSGVESNR